MTQVATSSMIVGAMLCQSLLSSLNSVPTLFAVCAESVIRDSVPGDFVETGVWRGGATIFMRAILKANDLCAREPERVAKRLVEWGYATRLDHAVQALKELPAIPIYFASSYALVKPYVVGFDTNLLDAPSLKHVRIDTSWQQPKQASLIWFKASE